MIPGPADRSWLGFWGFGCFEVGGSAPRAGERGEQAGEGTRLVQGAGRQAVLVAAGEDVWSWCSTSC